MKTVRRRSHGKTQHRHSAKQRKHVTTHKKRHHIRRTRHTRRLRGGDFINYEFLHRDIRSMLRILGQDMMDLNALTPPQLEVAYQNAMDTRPREILKALQDYPDFFLTLRETPGYVPKSGLTRSRHHVLKRQFNPGQHLITEEENRFRKEAEAYFMENPDDRDELTYPDPADDYRSIQQNIVNFNPSASPKQRYGPRTPAVFRRFRR
jgi:hypothetical protein